MSSSKVCRRIFAIVILAASFYLLYLSRGFYVCPAFLLAILCWTTSLILYHVEDL